MKNLIDKLYKNNYLNIDETAYILQNIDKPTRAYLSHRAHETRIKAYGNKVYMRGLIEFTNYCKMGCKYCGINRTNKNLDRYRLSLEDMLESCQLGYKLGYRTFVLQGGEDNYFTDEILVEIIKEIKNRYEDVAITLSVGEKGYESYEKYYKAGADRYLLRYETANADLFKNIHNNLKLESRVKDLYNLKKIGYQVGAGFMVGIPGQVNEDLAKDINLTSFSILMARQKGDLKTFLEGIKALENLKSKTKSKILIMESCTHNKSHEDIGSVKIPNLLRKHLQGEVEFQHSMGQDFPKDLSSYDLVIHCGSCMLNKKTMLNRIRISKESKTPITNYGIILAYLSGILDRAVNIF